MRTVRVPSLLPSKPEEPRLWTVARRKSDCHAGRCCRLGSLCPLDRRPGILPAKRMVLAAANGKLHYFADLFGSVRYRSHIGRYLGHRGPLLLQTLPHFSYELFDGL